VAVSRARHDPSIYTGDGLSLGSILSRSVSKLSAPSLEENLASSMVEKEQDAIEKRNSSSGTRPPERTLLDSTRLPTFVDAVTKVSAAGQRSMWLGPRGVAAALVQIVHSGLFC
jgi:hypothetical protein